MNPTMGEIESQTDCITANCWTMRMNLPISAHSPMSETASSLALWFRAKTTNSWTSKSLLELEIVLKLQEYRYKEIAKHIGKLVQDRINS